MKKQYGVYRSRIIVTDYRTKKLAIFKSKREADLLAQTLNQSAAGYYCAEYYEPKKVKGIKQ